MIRRWAAAMAALGLAVTGPAMAQEAYPSGPIQLVNPYPPDGATDLLARALAAGMAQRLGQPMIVVNRDGAAGAIGTVAVARAAADGYTLAFVPALVLSVLPVTQPNSGLQAASLRPVCQMFANAQAIAVRRDSRFRSLADVVAEARAAPRRAPSPMARSASPPSRIWPCCNGCARRRWGWRTCPMVATGQC